MANYDAIDQLAHKIIAACFADSGGAHLDVERVLAALQIVTVIARSRVSDTRQQGDLR
jgi:hypothetical protein